MVGLISLLSMLDDRFSHLEARASDENLNVLVSNVDWNILRNFSIGYE